MPQTKEARPASSSATVARYDSILTHVEPGLTSTHRTEVAARIARSFDARLIGLGAESVEPLPLSDPYSGTLTAEWIATMQKQVAADLESAQEAFRRDAAGAESEWRVVQEAPTRAMARASRAADLIVAGGAPPAGDTYRRVDTADLVLQAGRPVLVAPAGGPHLRAENIVVAWKDTREARRAVADAMPFLMRAGEVVVMSVCDKEAVEAAELQTADVAATLRRRGIPARSVVVGAPDASVNEELNAEAAAMGADLIVAGAYGHSRLAEWILGGATRELLRDPVRYLLLSH
jgi:nucleotide-binding universal stress UspA family protein